MPISIPLYNHLYVDRDHRYFVKNPCPKCGGRTFEDGPGTHACVNCGRFDEGKILPPNPAYGRQLKKVTG